MNKLLPEHMNVESVRKMGSLMGEVIAIDPPNAILNARDPVKVRVIIDINNPMRRGSLAITKD